MKYHTRVRWIDNETDGRFWVQEFASLKEGLVFARECYDQQLIDNQNPDLAPNLKTVNLVAFEVSIVPIDEENK